MEARFSSIEKSIESAKVWATLLYAGLAAVVFGGLAVDHRWLINREDHCGRPAGVDRDDAKAGYCATELERHDRISSPRQVMFGRQSPRAAADRAA